MPDRSSVGSQNGTLVVDGRRYRGWQTVEPADHDLPTGTYVADGAEGDTVTVGVTRTGGDWTLTKKYHRSHFNRLKNIRNPNSALVVHEVDSNNRVLSTISRATGVVKGITASGLDKTSGDPLIMTVRFVADGELG